MSARTVRWKPGSATRHRRSSDPAHRCLETPTFRHARAPALPDRRGRLFGRETDIAALVARASNPGLTVLTGGPRSGKTWTVEEVARRLQRRGRHIVGYHEATGGDSHMLRAVSDLYVRWLPDSSLRDQARSLWDRHRDDLVARAGQAFAMTFDVLKTVFPATSVGSPVRAFDTLANVNRDLLSGGLPLATLPYDQARALVNLVARLSGRIPVLILDAWDQSASTSSDAALLERMLGSIDEDWPPLHVYLALRQTGPLARTDAAAPGLARRLCDYAPVLTAEIMLPPMDLERSGDSAPLLAYLRSEIPAARRARDDELVEWIHGYPGVVDDWLRAARRATIDDTGSLRSLAARAQENRHAELDALLTALPKDAKRLAARIAFLPALDAERWAVIGSPWVAGDDAAFAALVDAGVLEDRPVPSYGHETRGAAALRWFMAQASPLIRREARAQVLELAALIDGDDADLVPIELLAASVERATDLALDPPAAALIRLAIEAGGADDAKAGPDVVAASIEVEQLDARYRGLVARVRFAQAFSLLVDDEVDSAVQALTRLIDDRAAPDALVAQALVLRGERSFGNGDDRGALVDLDRALLHRLPPFVKGFAYLTRAVARGRVGDAAGEMADYEKVISDPDIEDRVRDRARLQRARNYRTAGAPDRALEEYRAIRNHADPVVLASILLELAELQRLAGDADEARRNLDAAATLEGVPHELVSAALLWRNRIDIEARNWNGVLEGAEAVLRHPGMPDNKRALAHVLAAYALRNLGRIDEAVARAEAGLALGVTNADYRRVGERIRDRAESVVDNDAPSTG